MTRHTTGRSFVLGAALLWSLSGVLAKGIDLAPMTIAFYRSLFAGLFLLPMVPRRRWVFRPAMVPAMLVFGALIGTYIAAVKLTTAANAIYLQCTATFWLLPANVLIFREPLNRRDVAGIGLALAGCLAIVGFRPHDHPGELWGIVFGIASGLSFAVVVLFLRGLRALDPIWLSAVNNLGGALALGGWVLARTGPIPVPGWSMLAALAAFGLIQMAIPYALFARALHDVPAPEAALLGLLEPVLNPIWVYLFLHERPAPATLVGGLFLLGGVTLRYVPWPAARVKERS